MVRSALRACVVAFAIQGCADEPDELRMESPDPLLGDAESALEIAPISLCAQISGTYDYAPWAREYDGSARCVKQTTSIPAMGFATNHETSASFPEFTGINLVQVGQDAPATKCRKAGIRVRVRWLSDGTIWDYEVKAVPTYAPPGQGIPRVVSCVATHTSGLSGHGPGDYTITTTPFTPPSSSPWQTLPSFRPMTSRVEAWL